MPSLASTPESIWPESLAIAIAAFPAHAPEVRHWRHYPYVDARGETLLDAAIDEQLGACETYSQAFAAYLSARGFRAEVVEASGDPEVSYHRWTRVRVGGRVFNVDWTARQLHNLTDPPSPAHASLPSPLVWEGEGLEYPVLGVAFADLVVLAESERPAPLASPPAASDLEL